MVRELGTPAPLSPWRCYTLRSLHTALLVSTALLTPGWAAAQTPGCGNVCELYGGLLMAPERDVIGSIRTLEKVAKPLPGPRNTRGRWIQRSVYLGTEAFDSTFYIKSGLVQRIELVSTASEAQCRTRTPWAAMLATLQAWQGQEATISGEFRVGDGIQQSAHVVAGDVGVSVYLSLTPTSCATTVAFKKHDAKDASEL
ncbi:hypothetical protein [Rhodoferax sp. TS-BS-61-7]|uniref:hypothetical protein n=1 Tax=Rhodoferax sp. TS-BS-61-7 TaxID=2094194 RepID=UPI0011B0D52C|nr:hypothetical protein [Rhodoferax sp. TS-BS-61-7]